MDSIKSAITEKILPSIQNTLGSQRPGYRDDVDHRSSRLSRTTEAESIKKAWGNHSRLDFNFRERNQDRRDSSIDSLRCGNDHEIYFLKSFSFWQNFDSI